MQFRTWWPYPYFLTCVLYNQLHSRIGRERTIQRSKEKRTGRKASRISESVLNNQSRVHRNPREGSSPQSRAFFTYDEPNHESYFIFQAWVCRHGNYKRKKVCISVLSMVKLYTAKQRLISDANIAAYLIYGLLRSAGKDARMGGMKMFFGNSFPSFWNAYEPFTSMTSKPFSGDG